MSGIHLQIGEVSDRTGLSINTIRHYDQAGLVIPSARSKGGFRLYTEADVERLLLIRRMKPLGFSVEEMGQLLAASDRMVRRDRAGRHEREELRRLLSEYRTRAEMRRDQLRTELEWAKEFLDRMDRLVQSPGP